MADPNSAESLLRQLDAHRDAYLETTRQLHELLAQYVISGASAPAPEISSPPGSSLPEPQSPRSPRPSLSYASEIVKPSNRKTSTGLQTLQTSAASKATGEESDDDDDESYYVQKPLDSQIYDHEGLRNHLRSHKWDDAGHQILSSIVDNPARMSQENLFPIRSGEVDDRSHLSHHQVFDVGPDGAPVPVELPDSGKRISNALTIWNTIKEINKPGKETKAVGRITILRELSPILFGALHYTMNANLNVDELFGHLAGCEGTSADMLRAFDKDERKRRSFVFNFEYFTIVGDGCRPMEWQLADTDDKGAGAHHIPITRCSSVVALVLDGAPIKKIKNPARRADVTHGYVYDPWSAWHVLNIQCYPDWNASTDVHDSTKHYVNGPEAFLVTLLGEYRDSHKRFENIYKRVTALITPPLEFMFDSKLRDKLLFEDQHFTYSRRYFWAYQTLGIMNDSIKSMVDAYEDTFTDEVWAGQHRTLWPLLEQDSAKNVYFKKKMAVLRTKFEAEIVRLKTLARENDERRVEIHGLKEELFTGTSIQESRKSVENTEITIQQGHNIKILTLVSIFFLPLTFVTSVFGMTNMPTEHHYTMFGLVTATVCVPFFVLIGSLNTTTGMHFFKVRVGAGFKSLFWRRKRARLGPQNNQTNSMDAGAPLSSTATTSSNQESKWLAMRLRRWSTHKKEMSSEDLELNGTATELRPPRPVARPVEKPIDSFRLTRSGTSRIADMLHEEKQRSLKHSAVV